MVDLFTSDNSFFFIIIFPTLIDDPNKFEVKRMIDKFSGKWNVSASMLFFFLHFSFISWKPSLKWTPF